MGFPRQEYWSGLSFPFPGNLPNQATEPGSPTFSGKFFTAWATREALYDCYLCKKKKRYYVYTDTEEKKGEDSKKLAIYNPRIEVLGEIKPANTLILDF